MTTFEPGEGWRLLETDEVLGHGAEVITYSTGNDARSWIRYPSPQLPSAEGTTIRVTESTETDLVGVLLHLDLSDADYPWHGNSDAYPAAVITGFEVLAEPTPKVLYEEQQRVARAVIARIRALSAETQTPYDYHLDRVLSEFGVES